MSKTSRTFADLDLDFMPHVVTGDISLKRNVEAIKRSLRNLINLKYYEKPFNPQIGSGVRDLLFEPASPITASIIKDKIEEVVENFEPRVKLYNTRVLPDIDNNTFTVTMFFYIQNISEPVEFQFFLERLR